MILNLRHTTAFADEHSAEAAAFLLHLQPRRLAWQQVQTFQLRVGDARIAESVDSFGNPVARVFPEPGHRAAAIVAEAAIELLPRPAPPGVRSTSAWEHVGIAAQTPASAEDAAGFAFPSRLAPPEAGAARWAARSFPPSRPILACLLDLFERSSRTFKLHDGPSSVCAPVDQVMQRQAGATQDLAHALIAGLRALRLPARFVSGYADGHWRAFVGCWLGPHSGWVDFDPITGSPVGQEAICLGWGRDYADVSPVRGVLLGGVRHDMTVRVELAPFGCLETTSPPASLAM